MLLIFSCFKKVCQSTLTIDQIDNRTYSLLPYSPVPSYICCTVRPSSIRDHLRINWERDRRSSGTAIPAEQYTLRYLQLNHSSMENTRCLELYSRRPVQDTIFCSVQSNEDTVNKSVHVRFVSQESDPETYALLPKIELRINQQQRRGIAADLGSSLALVCTVVTTNLSPLHSIRWYTKKKVEGEDVLDEIHNGNRFRLLQNQLDFTYSSTLSRKSKFGKISSLSWIGTLQILDVQNEDAGTYMCEATNRHGSAVSTATRIAIRGQKIPVKILHPRSDNVFSVHYGESRILRCQAIGMPVPHTDWYKDGNRLQPDDMYQPELAVITVNITNHSEYECISRNAFSTDKRSITFQLKEYQTRPVATIVSVDCDSVKISVYSTLKATAIKGRIDTIGNDGTWVYGREEILDADEAIHRITDLQPNQDYRITVDVQDSNGIQMTSLPVEFQTSSPVPNCTITDLSVIQRGEDFIELNWSKCANNEDLNYVVLFMRQQEPSSSVVHWNKLYYSPQTRPVISNLYPNSSYILYVIPVNSSYGAGSVSNAATAVTLPLKAIDLKFYPNEAGYDLSWTMPKDTAVSHYILKYNQLSPDSLANSTEEEFVLKTNNFRVPQVARNIQVKAFNRDLQLATSDFILRQSAGRFML
ncbi:hypothetical protein ACOME3_005750 [Neoechinorhynchus agilis]